MKYQLYLCDSWFGCCVSEAWLAEYFAVVGCILGLPAMRERICCIGSAPDDRAMVYSWVVEKKIAPDDWTAVESINDPGATGP
jgi:hypothetical protein